MWFDEFHWHPRPPTLRERIGAGVFLAVFAFVEVDDLAKWSLFLGHDRQISVGLMLVGLVLFLRFFPTVRWGRED